MNIRTRHSPREEGFTLIEVMVGMFLLLVGVLGVATMMNTANAVTNETKARDAAVSLAREILEDARGFSYTDLDGSVPSAGTSIQTALATVGITDSDLSTPGFQLRRRNISFTVTVFTCVFDDPRDGIRAGNGTTTYCPASAAAGGTPVDENPDDYRQVAVDVRWSVRGGTPSCKGQTTSTGIQAGSGTNCVTQSELIANPSGGLGPPITAVTTTPPGTVEAGTSLTFGITTGTAADNVRWVAPDGQDGVATAAVGNTDGKQWTFTWTLGDIRDGSRTVQLQAFFLNAGGVVRPTPVTLNRFVPGPPALLNPVSGGVDDRIPGEPAVALVWGQSGDDDIIGYTVYRASGSAPDLATDTPVCSTAALATVTCFDTTPGSPAPSTADCPAGSSAEAAGHECINYYVVAFDERWSTGNPSDLNCPAWADPVDVSSSPSSVAPLTQSTDWPNARPGCPSAFISIDYTDGLLNNAPATPLPAIPTCTTSNGLAVINWTQPPSPDSDGDAIIGYRVYRDPQNTPNPEFAALANVLDPSAASYTDPTPTGGNAHVYYVTAVDQRYQESQELRIDWSPGACP